MAAITGSVKAGSNWTQTNSTGLPGALVANLPQNWQFTVSTSGNAADQANLKYTATLSLAAAPQVLDLTNLTDVFGGVVNFARVRSLAIRVKSQTDGQTLKLGYSGVTANAWTSLITNPGQITLQASTSTNDGFVVFTAPNTTGWTVGATNKLLNLDPGASTFTADIEILGSVA
jgi:hypothetical protein